jgi:hypothetical protein
MIFTGTVISLGLVLGSWASGLSGWFLCFTRPYRAARKPLVIAFGYVVVIGSTLGSLWLMREVSERMGLGRSAIGNEARFAWVISFVCVAVLVIASEVKWQRSTAAGALN